MIYERRVGSYEGLSNAWREFLGKYRVYITEETKLLERTYDDPAVTASERIGAFIGVAVCF